MAVVFLHGWGSYRIGPHRMLLDIARSLAAKGHVCLRFDFRGRGESEGGAGETSLLDMIEDTHQAVRYACSLPGIGSVALVGICSGAEVAVGAAATNPKVEALALLSAPLLGRDMRMEETFARSSGHAKSYIRKLFLPVTWRKLLAGQVDFRAVGSVIFRRASGNSNKEPAGATPASHPRPDEKELMRKFASFHGKCLFIYATNDPMAAMSEKGYKEACQGNPDTVFKHIDGANHNFYSAEWKEQIIAHISSWVEA